MNIQQAYFVYRIKCLGLVCNKGIQNRRKKKKHEHVIDVMEKHRNGKTQENKDRGV